MGVTNFSAGQEILSVEEMLAADDVEYAEVDVWGGRVRLGTLDAGTMLEFSTLPDGPDKVMKSIDIVVKSLVDKEGKRIGSSRHIDAFKRKSSTPITKIIKAVSRLNGTAESPLDFLLRVRKAKTDTTQLASIAQQMHQAADAIIAAGSDEKKLQELMTETPGGELKND